MFSSFRARHCALFVISLCGLAACSQPPANDTSAPATSTLAPTLPPATAPQSGARPPPPVNSKVAKFRGTLPCADCSGIDIRLLLERDALGRNSYVLHRSYRGRSTNPATSAGRWTLTIGAPGNPQIALIHLNSGRPGDQQVWRVNHDNSLTLVDQTGKAAPSKLSYTITRDGGDLDLHALDRRKPDKQ